MRYLKTNTATIVTVGPFYDKADGVTIETALTITNERITFVVDANDGSAPTLVLDNVTGATSGTSNDLNYITNCDAGLMQLELAAANVNYLGRAMLTITDAANHCPVFHEFMILPAMVFDSLIAGTDVLQADMTQILGTAVSTPATAGLLDVNAIQLSGDATAANNAESFFDGTGYAGTNNVIPTVTTVGTTTNLTNLPAAAATAAELAKVPKSDGSVSWNATALAAINAEVDTALNTAIPGSPTADSINERIVAIDAYGTPPTAAAIRSEMDSNSTKLANLDAAVSSRLATAGYTAPLDAAGTRTAVGLATANLDTQLAALPTDADVQTAATAALNAYDPPTKAELDSAVAPLATASALSTVAGYVDTEVAAIKAVTDKVDTALEADGATGYQFTALALENAPTGGSAPSAADIRAEIDSNSTQLAAIVADTNELQTNQGNWLTATGFATPTNITAGTITTVTNLTNAPTNGDLTATMKTSVTTAATAALEAYDPPTNAEMVARTLLAASYFDPATDTVARVTLVDTTTTNTDMVAAAPSAATVADAVWDEALSGHAAAGSTGAALTAASAAGDPWSTALPGAYGAGTAGKLLSDIEAVAPDNKPTVAATGEASANVTLWKDATAPAMTGDAFARLGAPAGASVSADIAAIAAASAAGSGAISFPVTINDESSNPIDGVEVWVSTDSAGASVVAGTLHTSALGVATFMLDAGTYYLWRQKSGYNFTNPVTITVS